mmetsp:Transcript_34260/g.74140  ORF Transcript_34260/g.74140 Transcript_34260/m.74140 type:complete len:350 (+) Transcript_34260:1242-2291(+)
METMTVDVVQLLIGGMRPDTKSAFEELYPCHAKPHDHNGRLQRAALTNILCLATVAEGKVRTVQGIVANATGQAFLIQGTGVNSSQAKRTLNQYGGAGGNDRRAGSPSKKGCTCDGCGSKDHMRTFRGVVGCPNRNKPGVFDTAQKNRAACQKKGSVEKNNNDSRARFRKRKPDLANLIEQGRAKIIRQAEALKASVDNDASQVSSVTTPSSALNGRRRGRGSPRKKLYMFLFDVVPMVFATGPRRESLPVAIDTQLPHIGLQLEPTHETPNCPTILSVADTAAALTTGNLFFISKIAKTFPHCVSAVYSSNNYSPITLSGIVRSDVEGAKTTTDDSAPTTISLQLALT